MSGILQSQNVYHGEWGHWISAHVLATIVILWISYDTELLAHKMDPSEWSQCIVFFVSILFFLSSLNYYESIFF